MSPRGVLTDEQREAHRLGQRRRQARVTWARRKERGGTATLAEIRALLFLGECLLAEVRDDVTFRPRCVR